MKNPTIKGLLTAFVFGMTVVPVAAETLTDALIHAYRNSPSLEQQRLLLQIEDDDVAIALAALRPTVSFQTEISGTLTEDTVGTDAVTTDASLRLILDYTLLDGGQRRLRFGAAKEAVLAARWNLIEFEQTVLLDAVNAYLVLREAVLIVDVRESNVRLLEQQLRAAQDRFDVGEVTRTDVAIADSRLAAARSSLAQARGQVDIQRQVYRLAIGKLPSGTLAAPPPAPELPPSLDRAQALALQVHPLILAGQHNVTSLTLLADAAEADRLPTVSVQGRAIRSKPDVSTVVGAITGDVPIYTGGRLSALNRQAILNAQAARAALQQTARVITEDVGRAWANLEIARAQIVANREGVRAAQLAFEGFREEALLGARTTLDVLDAEQELLDARTAVLTAETDALQAVYAVLASVGLLTTEHLGLSVERYDPSEYYRTVSNAPAASPSAQGSRLDSVLRRFGRN